jgi:hypothetical protein
MKSRIRRNTRRTRRTRNRTRRGGGYFSSKPKTYADNLALCNKSDIGGKYDPPGCDGLAKYYDFVKKNMIGDIDFTAFYPKVADPLFTSSVPSRMNPKKRYFYNGSEITDDELRKIKRYEQIGEKVLPKYDSGKIKIGYAFKSTPLTYEEVSSKTPEELEEFITGLPDMTIDDVNKLYLERGTKI